jgi:hypothetical protein
MLKKGLIIIGITAAVLVAVACSGTETLSERNWGKSYETAKYQQMLNPDAGKIIKPVDSLDGQAAENDMQRYRDSFKEKKEAQPVNLINLK